MSENNQFLSFAAPVIDRVLEYFDHSLRNPQQPSAALLDAMNPLFRVLEPLMPCRTTGETKSLWIIFPRGNIEDWESFEDAQEYDGVESHEEYEELWKESYPDEEKWYQLMTSESKPDSPFQYRDLEINNICLVNADLNHEPRAETWWEEEPVIAVLPFLIDAAQKSMDLLRNGVYNNYVDTYLPYPHRTGVIRRSDMWRGNPKEKAAVWEHMDKETFETFLSFLPTNNENKIGRITSFTANDFFPCMFPWVSGM